jgi:hypothetical protein
MYQVTDNITGQAVRAGMDAAAASELCRGLNMAAPGGRYRVDPDGTPVTYTRDQVSRAVNDGTDLVMELGDGERDSDLLNLAANAALTLLDNPAATLDDVILANYQADDIAIDWDAVDGDPYPNGTPGRPPIEHEISDEEYNRALIAQVKGWVS